MEAYPAHRRRCCRSNSDSRRNGASRTRACPERESSSRRPWCRSRWRHRSCRTFRGRGGACADRASGEVPARQRHRPRQGRAGWGLGLTGPGNVSLHISLMGPPHAERSRARPQSQFNDDVQSRRCEGGLELFRPTFHRGRFMADGSSTGTNQREGHEPNSCSANPTSIRFKAV